MDKKVNNILELIDYLEQTVKTSSNLLGKVSLNKKEMLNIISELKADLPEQFLEAKEVVEAREQILSTARREAEAIREDAKRRIQRELENSDVIRAAEHKANGILQEANAEAREVKLEANKYAKELKASVLNYADETLSNLQKEIDINGEAIIIKINKEVDTMLRNMHKEITSTTSIVRENIKDLGNMK
ncbi:hypothetical protein U732_1062 [Clostridium argentinense CDC 2741]|uniref:Archaeal/vacuolar-type H+-ATPase subunit H n=1 Tax=Clostridium argentinense CDC 2741 TaxID=1418104 RepID=A0A0C1U6I0_9CLOT|nr:hypothetical protein [Clostridium argentinense]ARC85695.1 hypothetical protein RSJ17_14845 [Clostridium argentinense]KIE47368.1 hypothetical protein U732_1062 [Clostridium argentinense CDC 2741]NFF40781.1 hypothetical protein [Clostridium argentinense]NFP50713.1 hypothetical protein [Clostridium argentinense]NFP73130.1 hypothetical protein [Clostridium argentinense]